MFFLNEYRDGRTPGFAPPNMNVILENAAKSSLDDVAWALVDHDIPRLYSPYSPFSDARLIDRGRMLEMSWQKTGQIFANLADWRKGVINCAACGRANAWRPGAIFNSTIVETGRPLLLGTTDLLASAMQMGPLSFYDWVPHHDLPVVTAVRLAATFPYVSPAARPLIDSPEYHAVDGGYYDNPGVSTLVEWLTEGLWAWDNEIAADPERVKDMPPILVIQIRSFPDNAARKPTPKGVDFQLMAPADALLNVRTSGQVIRNDADLRRLQTRWMRPDHKTPVVQVATLQFKAQDAPLSWAINSRQIQAVQDEWNQILQYKSDKADPCTHGAPAPERDLQLVRCVMQGSKEEVCSCLMRTKEPW
jgi:predicted acylesterase/phospholipase RssA